jgi:hypothetical protein
MPFVLLLVLAASAFSSPASLAMTSPYVRPAPRETLSLPRDDDADGQTPQQVITLLNWLDACYHAQTSTSWFHKKKFYFLDPYVSFFCCPNCAWAGLLLQVVQSGVSGVH